MDATNGFLWQAKLAAWLHDPPEKALILARTREGHEGGTAARLRELCFGGETLAGELLQIVQAADRWAAASDRPQWPHPKEARGETTRIFAWSRGGAYFVHPLGGDVYHLPDLYVASSGRLVRASSSEMEAVLKAAAEAGEPTETTQAPRKLEEVMPDTALFEALQIPAESGKEESSTIQLLRRAVLTLWRFGPLFDPSDLPPDSRLGEVWRLLPADSRVCDHSIWEHNALASAFAGALAADAARNPALLVVSLGPVQGFIEQARSTSDLWAGSHLLSRLAWEAMTPVVEELGPDAVLFPSLWGVPLVDLWLEDQGLDFSCLETRGQVPAWKRAPTDSNPLFSPCLPNRFVALVPANRGKELAKAVQEGVQQWARQQAKAALEELCAKAGEEPTADALAQIDRQLAGFPEVYWALVPFREVLAGDGGAWPDAAVESVARLAEVMAPFFGSKEEPGFLGHRFWKTLAGFWDEKGGHHDADAAFFSYRPNPGTLL